MNTTFGAQTGAHALTRPMIRFTGPHGPVLAPCGCYPTLIESAVDRGSIITIAIPGAFKAFHVLETPDEVEALFREGLDEVVGTAPGEVVDFPGSDGDREE